MCIEVRGSTSVSPLWTCIKVLTEHIVCTEQSATILNRIFYCLALSLSHSCFVYSILCVFCFYPVELVVISVKLPHINLFMVLEHEG